MASATQRIAACSVCQEQLTFEKREENYQAVIECFSYGFINVFERSLHRFPLQTVIQQIEPNDSEPIIEDTSNPKKCVAYLRKLATLLVRRLCDEVAGAPGIASQSLPDLLAHREMLLRERITSPTPRSSQFLESKLVGKSVDVLYRILLMHGVQGTRHQIARDSQSVESFLERFTSLSDAATTVAVFANNIYRRESSGTITALVSHVYYCPYEKTGRGVPHQ